MRTGHPSPPAESEVTGKGLGRVKGVSRKGLGSVRPRLVLAAARLGRKHEGLQRCHAAPAAARVCVCVCVCVCIFVVLTC